MSSPPSLRLASSAATTATGVVKVPHRGSSHTEGTAKAYLDRGGGNMYDAASLVGSCWEDIPENELTVLMLAADALGETSEKLSADVEKLAEPRPIWRRIPEKRKVIKWCKRFEEDTASYLWRAKNTSAAAKMAAIARERSQRNERIVDQQTTSSPAAPEIPNSLTEGPASPGIRAEIEIPICVDNKNILVNDTQTSACDASATPHANTEFRKPWDYPWGYAGDALAGLPAVYLQTQALVCR